MQPTKLSRSPLSKAAKGTLYGTLALVSVALGWDLILLEDGVEGNTISSVLQQQGWAVGLIGYASVHVARKPDKFKRPVWLTIFGGVFAAVAAQTVGGGIGGLLIGGGAGWIAWGNDSTT